MYNPKSLNACEFISDEEIKETIAYANSHKNDIALIDSITFHETFLKVLQNRNDFPYSRILMGRPCRKE